MQHIFNCAKGDSGANTPKIAIFCAFFMNFLSVSFEKSESGAISENTISCDRRCGAIIIFFYEYSFNMEQLRFFRIVSCHCSFIIRLCNFRTIPMDEKPAFKSFYTQKIPSFYNQKIKHNS